MTCDACDRPVVARGMCNLHYLRWRRRRGGDGAPPCTVEGCTNAAIARGMCSVHDQRFRRSGDVAAHRPVRRKGVPTPCVVDGCDVDAVRRGWCGSHYYRYKTYGDPHAGTRPRRAPNGSTWIDRSGYRVLTVAGRPAFEHRVIMEQLLGRPLRRDENVHHRNGQRADNRPENLELWSTSQPQGQRIEDKADWAVAFLVRYRPSALSPDIRGEAAGDDASTEA